MKTSFMTWVTHGIKRGRFEWDRQKARYTLAAIIGATLIAALYLLMVSQTAAQGRHIEQLRSELLQLEAQNESLEEEIARQSAVSVVTTRAAALGYVPVVAGQVEFLVVSSEDGAAPDDTTALAPSP